MTEVRNLKAKASLKSNGIALSWGRTELEDKTRVSIAEIPLLRGGYRTSTSHALQGGNAQKRGGGGVSHPIGHAETPTTP